MNIQFFRERHDVGAFSQAIHRHLTGRPRAPSYASLPICNSFHAKNATGKFLKIGVQPILPNAARSAKRWTVLDFANGQVGGYPKSAWFVGNARTYRIRISFIRPTYDGRISTGSVSADSVWPFTS